MAEKKESVGAIWKKQVNGKELLSITIGDKKYTAWANDYKKEDKHPDYRVFIDDYKKPEQSEFKGKTVTTDNRGTTGDVADDQLPF